MSMATPLPATASPRLVQGGTPRPPADDIDPTAAVFETLLHTQVPAAAAIPVPATQLPEPQEDLQDDPEVQVITAAIPTPLLPTAAPPPDQVRLHDGGGAATAGTPAPIQAPLQGFAPAPRSELLPTLAQTRQANIAEPPMTGGIAAREQTADAAMAVVEARPSPPSVDATPTDAVHPDRPAAQGAALATTRVGATLQGDPPVQSPFALVAQPIGQPAPQPALPGAPPILASMPSPPIDTEMQRVLAEPIPPAHAAATPAPAVPATAFVTTTSTSAAQAVAPMLQAGVEAAAWRIRTQGADAPAGDLARLDAFEPYLRTPTAGEVAAISTPHNVGPARATATDMAPWPTADLRGDDFEAKVAGRMMWMAEQKIGHAHIRLAPAELGVLEIQLRIEGDRVQADFDSPRPEVRQALESGLHKLRDMLGQHGFQLVQADVGHQRQAPPGAHATPAGRDDRGESAPSEPSSNSTPLHSPRGLLDTYA